MYACTQAWSVIMNEVCIHNITNWVGLRHFSSLWGVFLCLSRSQNRPRKPFFTVVDGWRVLVVRLKMDPKPMAITVHTKQMTL